MLATGFYQLAVSQLLAGQLVAASLVHLKLLGEASSRLLVGDSQAQVGSAGLQRQEQPLGFFLFFIFSGLAVCAPLALAQAGLKQAWGGQFVFSGERSGLSFVCVALFSFSFYLVARGSCMAAGSRPAQEFFLGMWALALSGPLALASGSLTLFFLALEACGLAGTCVLVFARAGLGFRQGRLLGRSIFLTYWSSFVSSAFVIFVVIVELGFLGTTDWTLTNLLVASGFAPEGSLSGWVWHLSAYSLSTGLVLKLGAGPFFFYKLEVYQGLPLASMVAYSAGHILTLGLVFYVFVVYLAPALVALALPGLTSLACGSSFYVGALALGLPLFRRFLGLSSVICGLNVVLLSLASLSLLVRLI